MRRRSCCKRKSSSASRCSLNFRNRSRRSRGRRILKRPSSSARSSFLNNVSWKISKSKSKIMKSRKVQNKLKTTKCLQPRAVDSPVLSNLQAISRTIIPSMSSAPTQVKRQVSKPNLSEDFWLSQARLQVEVSARCSILRSNQLYTQCTPPSLLLEPLAAKRNLLPASWV